MLPLSGRKILLNNISIYQTCWPIHLPIYLAAGWPLFQVNILPPPSTPLKAQAHTLYLGKNLKKWKMRKSQILWYLCQIIFNFEFFTPHIVKFDAGLVLFSSFFQFRYISKRKKYFYHFAQIFDKKLVKKWGC